MSTEMQIFVRKLITRINSSQNVQTVCQNGTILPLLPAANRTSTYVRLALLNAWLHVHACSRGGVHGVRVHAHTGQTSPPLPLSYVAYYDVSV